MPRRSLFAVLGILAAYNNLAAQVSVNDVHILPRSVPTSPARTEQTIRANVDLVLVSVTVLDHADRADTGLGPTNFAVLDDKDPQVVRYLSNVDEPISLIVILDASASMAAKIQDVRKAFTELVNTSISQDDFGLIILNDDPRVALHFDDSGSEI